MWFLKWIYQILLDEQGDSPAAGGAGQGEPPAGSGQGEPPGAGEGEGGGGQGGEPPATPAFGDFGDTPKTLEEATALLENIYGEHTKLKPEFETLKGKTTATERNLALTRKALEGAGIRVVPDEEGNVRLEVVNQPAQEKKMRFSDAHKQLFDEKVLEALRYLIQDEFDGGFDTREKTRMEGARKLQMFNNFYDQAADLMFSHFPQLNGNWDAKGNSTNQTFDKAFHDKVMERAREKYCDPRGRLTNPQGELLAALEIAKELGITAQIVNQAKAEGFQQGQAGKKILGPVVSGKKGAVKTGKLSFDEYQKLSPEEKVEYDKKQVGAT